MRNIVVGYDGSLGGRRALEKAAELRNGASVTVVSASPPVLGVEATSAGDVAEREKLLADAKVVLAERGVADFHGVHGVGDPADLISAEAEKLGAELIVVGTRGMNVVVRLVLGSVSTKVLHRAPCDVLVVR